MDSAKLLLDFPLLSMGERLLELLSAEMTWLINTRDLSRTLTVPFVIFVQELIRGAHTIGFLLALLTQGRRY